VTTLYHIAPAEQSEKDAGRANVCALIDRAVAGEIPRDRSGSFDGLLPEPRCDAARTIDPFAGEGMSVAGTRTSVRR
jgi:hypothetical protein